MRVYFHEGQDKLQIINKVILPRWIDYCNDNWLSGDDSDPYCPERRVKVFLDSVGYLLLRDNPEDTLTIYKECARGRCEIPVSSCPASVSDLLYGDGADLSDRSGINNEQFTETLADLDERAERQASRKTRKQPKHDSRYSQILSIRRQYPGCRFTYCRVDTENCFEYDGQWYAIDESVDAYSPVESEDGPAFPMEEIIVVRDVEGGLHFFDQALCQIEDDMITYPK